MRVARTIASVRKLVRTARVKDKIIGFVPTMGALHAGHVSLIKAATRQTDFIVVSIFVNPTQFGPAEDFTKYPRPLEQDLKICRKHEVDLVFAPSVEQMYPTQNLTWVNVEKLSELLCGKFRPGHFRGVATVCAKLFNIVMPDVAFFGQKDAQQAAIIKRMVADLNMPLRIVVCPTVREADGLAMSSRNRYLAARQRKDAVLVYRSLQKCEEMVAHGVRDTGRITTAMHKILREIPSARVQYVSIVDADTLKAVEPISGRVLAAVAVKVGSTRLIDNVIIDTGR